MTQTTSHKHFALIKTIQKIDVFKGFDGRDVQLLLKICRMMPFPAQTTIYAEGDPSLDMLILLRGEMSVRGPGGVEYARLGVGSPTGEMGMLTREPRSADVVATEDCTVLILERRFLDAGDGRLLSKIQQNVISILCGRLNETNALLQERTRELTALQRGDDDDELDDYDEFDDDDE
ncbi:MAG TPA: cyclic nucleotide-binding domain-containing protein [Candidatus Latescibacteria bacterium]|jgi:CRP-like cAMP-binding protein|nr:cyclic nucleotide-binding domain-containing protein [Candidatus Latescibacterota bacterium]HJP31297.1 cyclic nucleotide-binding domain-containing protein [Candidatus Latescibacterota bacterium]